MMMRVATRLIRLAIPVLLAPVLLLLFPLVYLLAWVHEAIADLTATGRPLRPVAAVAPALAAERRAGRQPDEVR